MGLGKRLLVCLACLLALPCQGHADAAAKVAIIDFFPFGYSDADGNATGMFVDMAQVIERYSGLALQPVLLPVPRAIREVTSGAMDMLISYKDPLMVKNVAFVGNVGCLTSMLVPRTGVTVTGLAALNGRKVSFITGGYFHRRFADKFDIHPLQVPSNESMMRMLVRGRTDIIVINSAVFNAYLSGTNDKVKLGDGWRGKISVPLKLEEMETHLSISNQSAFRDQAARLNTAIAEARRKGEFEAIYQKYGAGSSQCGNDSPLLEEN